jgi:hypothetical protein
MHEADRLDELYMRDQLKDGLRLPRVPRATRAWIRVLIGLGISTPIALLPLIGKSDIAPFDTLLALIPDSIQGTVIPLSCAVMSIMAASVEFRVLDHVSRQDLLISARRGLALLSFLLILFLCAYSLLVTNVTILNGSQSVAIITGLGSTNAPPCTGMGVEECLNYITLKEAKVSSYFGDGRIRVSKIILETLYISFFGAFGNVAGILVQLRVRPLMGKRPTHKDDE